MWVNRPCTCSAIWAAGSPARSNMSTAAITQSAWWRLKPPPGPRHCCKVWSIAASCPTQNPDAVAGNSFGTLFRFTTWGESHGPAIGCVVDGTPPRIALKEDDIQHFLDRRKPGQSRFTTQRQEADAVKILSGVFEGETTGTPIQLLIENTDQRPRDYTNIKDSFRPGHADYTYWMKYGIRDYRGGGRASARETASRVAAGAIARLILAKFIGQEV